MNNILSNKEISEFKKNGAIFLKKKFDINWIKLLQDGIDRDKLAWMIELKNNRR